MCTDGHVLELRARFIRDLKDEHVDGRVQPALRGLSPLRPGDPSEAHVERCLECLCVLSCHLDHNQLEPRMKLRNSLAGTATTSSGAARAAGATGAGAQSPPKEHHDISCLLFF